MIQTPVLFLIFNRPSTTQQVFDAIANAKPQRLYIAADAPRLSHEDDVVNCALARKITENITWPCEVKRLYQSHNLGCSLGPRAAFNWFFEHEEAGIILEDDCLPHTSFFTFCSEMLERYKNDDRIISINGSNLGFSLQDGNSYTFSRFMNMWGWATWRRCAQKIDYNLHEWKLKQRPLFTLYKWMRQGAFDADLHWYRYWQHKFDLTVQQPNITWWDWQWIYHQLRDKQYSIVPAQNLVTNIGFSDTATHTKEANNPSANIVVHTMAFPLRHPVTVTLHQYYEEHFVKWVWCYHKRIRADFFILSSIKKLFKHIRLALIIIQYLNLNTILFNFKYFKFHTAIFFPVFVSKNVVLKKKLGVVSLPNNIYPGIIKLGFGDVGIFDIKKSKSIWEVKGKVEFKGATNIGHGSKICVGSNGHLCFGSNFNITAESSIVCFKNIKFGDNCLLSWEILIIDTDFHKVFANCEYLNPDKQIIIGDKVWIGARSTILKGSSILSNTVIAACSVVNKRFTHGNVIIAGSPAIIVKDNIEWNL